MLLYPPDKVFNQEDPLPADLVRGKSLFHELTYCLMANIQKLLCFSIGVEYTLNFLFFLNWLSPEFFSRHHTIAGEESQR